MVLRSFKIPKHGGPDGQGLPLEVFTELLKLFSDAAVSDQDAEATMLLSFGTSQQQEWNELYRPQLLEFCIDTAEK